MKKKIKILTIFILIGSTSWLFTNSIINQHSHITSSGIIITHSHPYTPDKNNHSPFQSHTHDANTLFLLAQLSNPLISFFSIYFLIVIISISALNLFSRYIFRVPLKNYFFSGIYRAPPAML